MSDTSYPHSIDLIVAHLGTILPIEIARSYVQALRDAGLGDVVEVCVASRKKQPGGWHELSAALEQVGAATHFVWFRMADGTTTKCLRSSEARRAENDSQWQVSIRREVSPTEAWIAAMVKVARAAVTMPGFHYTFLERDGGRVMAFLPRPPLARSFHLTTVSEQEVSERFDDPSVFWRVWDAVETIGDVKLCTRALDVLDEEEWLTRTFEDTMALARHARPGLTYYDNDPYWYPLYAPWWQPGDYQDEKAGPPALTLVGYIEAMRTVQYSGYIARSTPQSTGDEPLHVLIIEIHAVRELVAKKKTDDGRPVDAVHILFAEEWMARQERRPLRDVGAKVFYLDARTAEPIEVTD